MIDPKHVMRKQLQEAKNISKARKQQSGQGRIKFDPQKYSIVSLSYPVETKDQKSKRRFIIQIRYTKKGQFKKFRNKMVMFGYKNVKQYVDDHDQQKRMIRIASLKNTQNIFQPNHWRLMLLNRQRNLVQAYTKYLKDSGLA